MINPKHILIISLYLCGFFVSDVSKSIPNLQSHGVFPTVQMRLTCDWKRPFTSKYPVFFFREASDVDN